LPYEEGKIEFINELHLVLSSWQGPTLVGGDFNLSRFPSDKSNGRINLKRADCFNDWVNRWGLIKINPSNRKYTWSNNQWRNLVLAKLDIIFISTDWESAFPLVRVQGLAKSISDHTPLLIDSGDNLSWGKKKFKFEKWWLMRLEFSDLVKKAWSLECSGIIPLDRWQAKVRFFRRLTRGWAGNVIAELSKYKQSIAAEYNCLDMEVESRALDEGEKGRLQELSTELEKLWALEEIKSRQRSRDRDILEGDRNTSYFHVVANQRFRKKRIDCLMGVDGMVHDNSEILKIAASFYKNLFKREERGNFSLGAKFWGEEDRVSAGDLAELEAPFSEQEIKSAVFSCYPEGSPGPDGLTFLFYQKIWELVKEDVWSMVEEFYHGRLELFRLNFAMLTLIPKVDEAVELKIFRPISLLNCSFKIFSKLITLRLERVCQSLVAKEQSAFIRGRFILKSVVVAHELVYSMNKSKTPGVVIKLDYEKAYDRVNIDFLLEILQLRGFGERWIGWIKSIVIGGGGLSV
jgi:hypothetical protein